MHNLTPIKFFCLTVFLMLGFMHKTSAQDSIRMKTGAVYSVKILEITETQVKYRTYANPDGPLYNISKSTIDRYKLEGRTWERFNETEIYRKQSLAPPTPTAKVAETKNSYIGINLPDLFRTDLTIFYEYVFINKIGLRIPVTYGFRSGYFNPNPNVLNPIRFNRNTVFKTGIDLRIYSGRGNGRARFSFGPSIYYMRLNRQIPSAPSYSMENMYYKVGNSIRLLFIAGVLIRPTDDFQLGIEGGMGGDIDIKEPEKQYYTFGSATVPKAQLNIHLGYRF